jgi:hypothetical protein
MRTFLVAIVLSAALAATASAGDLFGGSGAPGFAPSVPVSALARPAAWLDPSRLHFSTSLSVGSAFGTTQGLQITSLHYDFAIPLSMSVSMGNMWGPSSAGGNGSPFLEGLNLSYRPLRSLQVNIQYQDIRSPLQFQDQSLLPRYLRDFEYR